MADEVVEVDVAGGSEAVELASADLWAAGATAVGEQDRGAGGVTLVASFPTAEAARVVAAEVEGRLVTVDPAEWRDVWKDFAQPMTVGDSLVVAPAWRDVPVEALLAGGNGRDRPLVVRIDPGPCFGSGSHPSTRLILGLLMEQGSLEGQRVLDVGCGSGILSVTAACLGATVVAVDIDPDAVAYTVTNAEANGVADRIEASTRAAGQVGGGFDLALVNVTAAVQAVVGPAAAAAVRAGGTLLLAGLLPGQWRHVADAYPGTTIVDRPGLDGWEGAVLARG